MAHIGDINVEDRIENGVYKIPGTEKDYANYLNQFCIFLEIERRFVVGEKMLEAEILTDHNMAAFYFHLKDKNDSKPHFLKGTRAAFAYALKRNGLPNPSDFQHLYPLSQAAVEVIIYLFFN